MTPSPTRQLHSTPRRYEIPDLLQTIFAAEVLAPSSCLWLVSPWISDIPVLDNRTDAFASLEPDWARQRVRLSQALAWLGSHGSTIHVATRNDNHNHAFLEALKARASGRRTHIHMADQLHEKGLLGDGFYLSGSMNFTHGGISSYEEIVHYFTGPEVVAKNRIAFSKRWGDE
jgi:hypothetical protein